MITVNNSVRAAFGIRLVEKVVDIARGLEKKINGDVEINIVGDIAIKKLNKLYRNKNQTTDVLSFAWQEDKKVKTKMLGQIYLCYPQIRRQASVWDVPVKEECVRMLVHGLLHLAGYDHKSGLQKKRMFSLQEKIILKCKTM